MTDQELIAAKHCVTAMDGVRGVYLSDFLETSNNHYARAYRRSVEDTSDTMRTAVEWIREGKAEMAAAYLEGFIIPTTIEVDPEVAVFLDLYYEGDKRNLDDAVADLEAFRAAAAAHGLKVSFKDD